MGDKKIICIMLFVLLLGFIPLTVAAENQTSHPVIPAGYSEKHIFGIIPRISGDNNAVLGPILLQEIHDTQNLFRRASWDPSCLWDLQLVPKWAASVLNDPHVKSLE